MKKTWVLLLVMLLVPLSASALDLKELLGIGGSGEGGEGQKKKEKTKYIIHLKNGGEIEADNYAVGSKNIMVMMPAGAIYLEKDMVRSIEEVTVADEESVQKIEVEPSKPEKPAAPATREKKPAAPAVELPEMDDEGHTEEWWQKRIEKWAKQKGDAEARYKQAESDWNRYEGQLNALDPAKTSDYDILRFQDLRGSARVEMDRAQADIDEATRMLDEVMPDEARQAGAPPGWVRY